MQKKLAHYSLVLFNPENNTKKIRKKVSYSLRHPMSVATFWIKPRRSKGKKECRQMWPISHQLADQSIQYYVDNGKNFG